ncbi:hypothetical protein MKW94_020023 [Papaver nudicaule]|uniref:Uncharacterized protein n=1 Tax=Papaver nudicaule TaxID=74823 RepID=A0AA41RZN2_PAPNU|nr:hypothetical protein [Papaver nudicaule]
MYVMPLNSTLPDYFPISRDDFQLHSVVVPSAAIKDSASSFDAIPNEWFTPKKKKIFTDSGVRVIFVSSPILAQLVLDGSMEELREVLEKSDPSWHPADSVDSHGQPLLHLAISQGRADLVQLLLEFEPDMTPRDRSGRTALEAAVVVGEALIVELLLARRVGTDRSESSGYGPIHLAAQGGHFEIMRLLLLKGANYDALTSDGRTPLHLAVAEQKRDCVKLMLANGAKTDIGSTIDGETPLHLAANLGDEQMVKLLLQKGANKYIRDKYGKTPYDMAAESGQSRLFNAKGELRTIHRLLERGASINGKDQHGWTALHRAAFKGNMDIVRMLLDKGAYIDSRDEDGYTALHCASEAGHGVDIEAQTNKGLSAMHIVESLQYSGITRILTQGDATKDRTISSKIGGINFGSFGIVGKEMENKEVIMKRKASRGRAVKSSLDRSMPMAIL